MIDPVEIAAVVSRACDTAKVRLSTKQEMVILGALIGLGAAAPAPGKETDSLAALIRKSQEPK